MKIILTILSLLVSVHAWSQLDFKEVRTTIAGAKTDFKTVDIGDINNDGLNDLVIGSGFYFDDIYEKFIPIHLMIEYTLICLNRRKKW